MKILEDRITKIGTFSRRNGFSKSRTCTYGFEAIYPALLTNTFIPTGTFKLIIKETFLQWKRMNYRTEVNFWEPFHHFDKLSYLRSLLPALWFKPNWFELSPIAFNLRLAPLPPDFHSFWKSHFWLVVAFLCLCSTRPMHDIEFK